MLSPPSSTINSYNTHDIDNLFYLIENSDNDLALRQLERLITENPLLLDCQDSKNFIHNPIFVVIRDNKLKALNVILDKCPFVLGQKFGDGELTPIFFAIDNDKKEVLEIILKKCPEVLEQKFGDGELTPILFAIHENKQFAVESILKEIPNAIIHRHPEYDTPIFFAIFKENISAIDYILRTHPEGLEQKSSDGDYSPILYAISENSQKILKYFLNTNPQLINQLDEDYGYPVFFAILCRNKEIVDYFFEKNPLLLFQEFNQNTPFEYAFGVYLNDKKNNSPNEIAKSKSILNSIYQKHFQTTRDISDRELEILEEYYTNFSHLAVGYSEYGYSFTESSEIAIYKSILGKMLNAKNPSDDTIDNKDPQILFAELSLKTMDSVNSYENPMKFANERIYIFNSGINDHVSYFTFHVNHESNMITDISYCDGNPITTEHNYISDRSYLNGGARKFNLDPPIEFSKKFVDNFLQNNSQGKKMKEFYQALQTEGLKIVNPLNPELIQNLKISTPEFYIPTTHQYRENCSFKSLKILLRYIAKSENPELDFSSRHLNMVERKIDGTGIYKKFKSDLTISAIENLKILKEKLLEMSDINEDLIAHLNIRIYQIMEIILKNAHRKIEANKDDPKLKEELKIHQEIAKLSQPLSTISVQALATQLGKRSMGDISK